MTKEDIEKAAVDSCVIENSIFNPELIPYYEQGFKDGAEWRINSVWHNVNEEPTKKKLLIVIESDGHISQSNFMVGVDVWKDFVKDADIVEWCYKEDLLPINKTGNDGI